MSVLICHPKDFMMTEWWQIDETLDLKKVKNVTEVKNKTCIYITSTE